MCIFNVHVQVSVEDIAQMKTKTLYNFGVVGYEDAKLIVDTAKKHVESPVDLAEATPEEQGRPVTKNFNKVLK